MNHNLNYSTEGVSTGVLKDLESWRRDLVYLGINHHFARLRKANLSLGVFAFVCDWTIVLCAFFLCLFWPILTPLSLLIVGAKQRGLSNLIHDASHGNLIRRKKINDFLTDIMAGIALISPVKNYRASHLLHHRYLGHTELDPDVKMHLRYGYNDMNPPHTIWYKNILFLIFNFEAWKDSNIGSWSEINTQNKLAFLLWWSIITLVLNQFMPNTGYFFLIFWQFARATTYHVVRIMAEFFDHSGLPIGSITKNTRVGQDTSWIGKKIFHGHNDHLHALHHLDPLIPHYRLQHAHKLIDKKQSCYNHIKRYQTYFTGTNAVAKELVGVL